MDNYFDFGEIETTVTTGTGNAFIDTAGFSTILRRPISGSGSITELSSGAPATLTLAYPGNSYNGGTIVNSGTLVADYSQIATGTSGALPNILPSTTAVTLANGAGLSVLGRPNGGTSSQVWTTSTNASPVGQPANNTNVIWLATGNITGLSVGEAVSGPGIVAGTYIVAVYPNNSNSVLVLSNTVTASGTGFMTFTPYSNVVNETVGSVNLISGTSTLNVNNNGGTSTTLTVTGGVQGSGALAATGNGVVILNGSSGYTGATAVNGGTMIVSGSIYGTPTVSVASGATLEVDGYLNTSATTTLTGSNAVLRGTGLMDPIIANGGTIAPGLTVANATTSEGVLTTTGSISLSGSTNFAIRLALTSGSSSDQLAINGGGISLNNAHLVLTLGGNLNDPANIGNVFVIINGGYATGDGQFAQGLTYNAGGGFMFAIDYGVDSTGNPGGTDVDLVLTAIPEPGTWAAMLSGFGMLLCVQRIRRRSRH